MLSIGAAVTNIKLRNGETQIRIGKLRVGLSLSELIKSPEDWTLGSLIMDEVRLSCRFSRAAFCRAKL